MQAILLAAGLGTRLRPLTDKLPKPLLPVKGKPLIYYSLELLKKYNITDVIINVHYFADMIKEELGDGSKFGLKIVYSEEKELLETGGGIKYASRFLQGDEPFLVLNSDTLINVDLNELINFHKKKKAVATMVVRKNNSDKHYSIVKLDSKNRIRDIKGNMGLTGLTGLTGNVEDYMFAGVQILEPKVLDYLKVEKASVIEGAYFPLLHENKRIFGFKHDGDWSDVGTVEGYRAVAD